MKRLFTRRRAKQILTVIGALYAALALYMYFNQRALLYHPNTDLQAPEAYKLPVAAMETTTPDGVRITLWYRPPSPGEPTIVFFHGNSGNLSGRVEKLREIIAEKYGLLAVSYRGFGTSTGKPTEQGLYNDARAALAWLKGMGVPLSRTILYGESLGTAVAVQMAVEFPKAQALVLEAPFASMAEVGQVHYPYLPVWLLLRDRFDSIGKIRDVHMPVLIVQGTNDEVVPVEEGQELLAAANEPKQGAFIPGMGHNNLHMQTTLIYLKSFLSLNRIKRTQR